MADLRIIELINEGIDLLNRIGEEDAITNELLEEGADSFRAIRRRLNYEFDQIADENNATKNIFYGQLFPKTHALRNRWMRLQRYYRAPLRNTLVQYRAKLEELANAWADLESILPPPLTEHEPNVEGGPPLGGAKKRKGRKVNRKSRKASKKSRKTRRR